MAYSDFDKLKAFFFELKNAKFRPEKMRSRFVMNGGWATVNKAECFDLLRKKIPDLRGKDDAFLIKYLSDPNNIKNRVLAGFVAGERIELEKSLADKSVTTEVLSGQETATAAPAGQVTQPAGTNSSSAGGMPFGIPSAPTISSMPRAPRIVIRNVPQAPKPDIAIANKSGVVAEKPPPGAQIITSREAIRETGDPSKLVTARSNGSIIKPTSANPAIHIADKSGNIVKTYNIKSPGWLKNFGSNVGSKINIGLNKGLNKAISGINNFSLGGGGAGGSRSVFSRLGRFGRGGGTAGGGSLAGKAKSRGGLIFAGSIIAMMLLTGVLTMIGTTPTGEAAPLPRGTTTGGTYGLDYTLPLKDPSIQPLDIRDQVKSTFPGAKLEYWDKIVQRSKDAKFNSALTLALWIEETGASHTTLIKNGGSEIPVNGKLSLGHLGCAPWEDQTIDESLTCLFKFASNYTNDQFAQFMAAYSGGPADNPFSNNPDFPANIKTWYSKLVPSGPGAITTVSSVPPPPTDGNYAGWVKTNFNIDVSALSVSYQQWAYEILSTSAKADIAPKFKDLISRSLTKVVLTPGDEGSHTSGDTVYIRPGYDVNFFKQIFTHELGHRIKGTAGTTSPACNGQTIEQIESEGYLTYYAEHATPAQVRTPACGDNDQITRSDEDFGESVSYYINNEMGELNYGSDCSTYNSVNPYTRGDRPAHKAYIQCLLGP